MRLLSLYYGCFPIVAAIVWAQFSTTTTFGSDSNTDSAESPKANKSKQQRFFSTLLNNELPFSNPQSSLQLRYSVKAADLIKEPYIRFPFELRYGISEYTESYLSYKPFLNNPFDSHAEASSGIVGLGIKHRLPNFLDDNWDFALGIRTFAPLSEIPSEDPRNQFARYEPYIVMTYRLPSDDRFRWTLHTRYDWINGEPFFENNLEDRPRSTFYLRPGIIFTPPGEWRYTLEFEYQTERLSGASNDGTLINATVGWFPENRTWLKSLPGDLDLTLRLGYALSQLPIDQIGSPEELDLRIRWSRRKKQR